MSNPIRMVTIDTETTALAPSPFFRASPYWPTNKIHLLGVLSASRALTSSDSALIAASLPLAENTLLIGHNLKFDLAHLAKTAGMPIRHLISKTTTVWDTMVADYILSGQIDKPRNLQALCAERGIPFVKDIEVIEWFAKGHGADTFPDQTKMREYLKADLQATQALAEAQMANADPSQYALLAAMMETLLALTEIEMNGLPWDPVAAIAVLSAAQNSADIEARNFEILVRGILGTQGLVPGNLLGDATAAPYAPVDLLSPNVLRKLLFAHELKWTDRESVATKKGGTRMRRKERTAKFVPLAPSGWVIDKTPSGEAAVDEQAIDKLLAESGIAPPGIVVIETYKRFNARRKLISTYLDGSSKFVIDGYVHSNYNQTVTRTGRLSCSGPNLQNPPPEAMACYSAPDGWVFMEMDWKQIEVVGLAILSGDKQLLEDIRTGTDVHTALFFDLNARMPSKLERKEFKPLTFGLIYGAGDKTLAANSGKSIGEVRRFRKTFFSRYPQVAEYYEAMNKKAIVRRVPGTGARKSSGGVPLGLYFHQAPTGRTLVFEENELPWDKTRVNFSPADLMNWPVQSFATGDVVLTMLGVLARRLWEEPVLADHAKLVGTKHDSILLMVHERYLADAWKLCYDVLSKTSEYIARYYRMDVPVSLDFSATTGVTWQQCGAEGATMLSAPV